MYAPHRTHANIYRTVHVQTGVEAGDPHRLVTLLFEGLLESIARARGALQTGDIETKCLSIVRAVKIVEEGLRASLNLQAGGKIAEDLDSLYDYVCRRLTHANLKNDERALEECAALIRPLNDAWAAIRPAVSGVH